MAFLMLLHEKMRLKRQVNKLTAKQLKNGNFLDRMTKKIEQVQKRYSKQESQLEKQASIWEKQFTAMMQNGMGLGTMNQTWNPYGGGMTSFVYQQMAQLASGPVPLGKNADGSDRNVTIKDYQGMLREYQAGTLKAYYKDGTLQENQYGSNGLYDKDQFDAFQAIMQQAQMNQSQAQQFVQMQTTNYQQNASIWLEAAKNQLELEQEMALAPLEEMQTDYELEKNSIEAQLTLAKERLQTVEQELGEQVKNNTPKFGLG